MPSSVKFKGNFWSDAILVGVDNEGRLGMTDDGWLTEFEWRERYRPIENPLKPGSEYFESGYEAQTAFLLAQDPRCVWSEMWNWDSDSSNLRSGYVPFEHDAVGWYVCEVPVSEDFVFVELDEDGQADGDSDDDAIDI